MLMLKLSMCPSLMSVLILMESKFCYHLCISSLRYRLHFDLCAIFASQGSEAFWKAQENIYRVLEEQFYPAFLLSDLFHHYTKKRSEGRIVT